MAAPFWRLTPRRTAARYRLGLLAPFVNLKSGSALADVSNAAFWGAGTPGAIAAVESADTAAIVAANWTSGQIASNESGDITVVLAEVTTGFAIAATEAGDLASILASATTGGAIAGVESTDVAAIMAGLIAGLIAATESSDAAAIAASATVGAAVSAVESEDTAQILANANVATLIAATESGDTASVSAVATVGAGIAAAERADLTSLFAAVTTGAVISTVESSDRAAINKAARAAFAFVKRRYGILLYEPLPLRKSGALGNFAEEFVLAHRYGDLTSGRFTLNRLNDTDFFAADHPMGISDAFIDSQKTSSWDVQLKSDSIGHTWTEVRFAAPVPAGAVASATGTGKRNPRTGALIENPADIIEDALRIAGRDDRWWDQLRAEAAKDGLRLAGSIDQALSIRATIDAICASAGAIWCPGMARLYPVDVSGYVGSLDKMKVANLVVSATLDNTADVLRLYYDPDKASGKSQHYIEVTANPKIYGGLPTNLSFDWLRTPSNAESVARRVLPWLAGERYDVAFDCGDPTVRPGQWRKLVGHPEWPFDGADPVVMILEALVKPGSKTVACKGQALVSQPAAVVTAHSVALPTTRDAGVEIAVTGGKATLRVFDTNDQPVFAAEVSLDGSAPKKTLANGSVTFLVDTTPGKPKLHTVIIKAPGKRAQKMTIPL